MEEKNKYKWKVFVKCFTFNQAPYISDTMNGFALQQTKFPFVCVIVDDASTDGEQEVIRDFLEEHFNMQDKTVVRKEETGDFRLVYARHKENKNCYFAVVYLKYNHYSIKKSKRPYINEWLETAEYQACCEGDDYWIHPGKLQKQVSFLDSHPDVGLVHAKARIYNQEHHCFKGTCGAQNGDFEQILLRNPIVTLTTCYRTSLYLDYVKGLTQLNVKGWMMGDYPMWIWFSYHAKVYFDDEVFAVYREVNGSATHKSLESRLSFINSTKNIQLEFADYFQVKQRIKDVILYNYFLNCALVCIKFGQNKNSIHYMKKLTLKDKVFCLKIMMCNHYFLKR